MNPVITKQRHNVISAQKSPMMGSGTALKVLRPPDDLHQLTHVDVIRNQELGLIQDRKLFLPLIALDDHLQRRTGNTGSQFYS